MNQNEFFSIPEKRVALAKDIISKAIPSLNSNNVLGVFGFGNFWFASKKTAPEDIDIAVFVNNDSQFMSEDRPRIADPLTSAFNLPVEFHVLTPYTPMVKNQLKQYRVYMKKYSTLYGQTPSWL